jgi:hypothetical protein
MTATFPAPLVPAEVDLRDFPGMWVDTDRLVRSDTWILGNSDEKAAAFTLWAESWHQVPAASLPDNDRVLAKLSQAEKWSKSKGHALRGWVRCSDGRLYHPVVAEKALEAWIEKLAAAISGATGNAKRWQVEVDTSALRAQFQTAVETLRRLNPASRTLKKKVVAVILAGSGPQSGGDSGPDSGGDSGGDSGPDRKGQGQGQGPKEKEKRTPVAQQRAPVSDPQKPEPEPEADPPPTSTALQAPTAAGAICLALRRAGLQRMNPGHPTLAALIAAGATQAELVGLVPQALTKGEPFSWLLAAATKQRAEAAEVAKGLHRGPIPQADDRKSRQLAGAAVLTGAHRAAPQPVTEYVVDVESRVIPT